MVEPLLYSVKDACILGNLGKTRLYELLGAGILSGVRDGGKTKIVAASLHAYVNNLPPAQIKPSRRAEERAARRQERTATAPAGEG